MNKKYLMGLGLAGLVALTSAANAAVITLESVTPAGSNFTFNYQGTLGPDEGVQSGDRLIIYDFAGYVDGSIFATSPLLTTSTEFTTVGLIDPSQSDNPTLVNLIFTYNGPDFQTSGGPFAPVDFNGLGAVSIFQNTRLDAFTTFTTKNNPDATEGTVVTTLGTTQVPGAVPEPASWLMMIGGFGMVGFSARRRRLATVAA